MKCNSRYISVTSINSLLLYLNFSDLNNQILGKYKEEIMKSRIISVALLASLSAGAQAGDIEKVLGGVLLGVVISNQLSERNYGPPPQVQIYSEPVYSTPQVIYSPTPTVVYSPGPVYSYEHRHDHGHHRGWQYRWRD